MSDSVIVISSDEESNLEFETVDLSMDKDEDIMDAESDAENASELQESEKQTVIDQEDDKEDLFEDENPSVLGQGYNSEDLVENEDENPSVLNQEDKSGELAEIEYFKSSSEEIREMARDFKPDAQELKRAVCDAVHRGSVFDKYPATIKKKFFSLSGEFEQWLAYGPLTSIKGVMSRMRRVQISIPKDTGVYALDAVCCLRFRDENSNTFFMITPNPKTFLGSFTEDEQYTAAQVFRLKDTVSKNLSVIEDVWKATVFLSLSGMLTREKLGSIIIGKDKRVHLLCLGHNQMGFSDENEKDTDGPLWSLLSAQSSERKILKTWSEDKSSKSLNSDVYRLTLERVKQLPPHRSQKIRKHHQFFCSMLLKEIRKSSAGKSIDGANFGIEENPHVESETQESHEVLMSDEETEVPDDLVDFIDDTEETEGSGNYVYYSDRRKRKRNEILSHAEISEPEVEYLALDQDGALPLCTEEAHKFSEEDYEKMRSTKRSMPCSHKKKTFTANGFETVTRQGYSSVYFIHVEDDDQSTIVDMSKV